VNVGNYTTSCNGRLDESIKLFVSTNRQLQMTRRDTLHFQVLGRITSQFQDLCSQILEDGGRVDSSGRSDSLRIVDGIFEETMNTTDGELETSLGGSRLRSLLARRSLATLSALASFAAFSRL
jgi:hypothetical protein